MKINTKVTLSMILMTLNLLMILTMMKTTTPKRRRMMIIRLLGQEENSSNDYTFYVNTLFMNIC